MLPRRPPLRPKKRSNPSARGQFLIIDCAPRSNGGRRKAGRSVAVFCFGSASEPGRRRPRAQALKLWQSDRSLNAVRRGRGRPGSLLRCALAEDVGEAVVEVLLVVDCDIRALFGPPCRAGGQRPLFAECLTEPSLDQPTDFLAVYFGNNIAKQVHMVALCGARSVPPAAAFTDRRDFGFNEHSLCVGQISRRKFHALPLGGDANLVSWQKRLAEFVVGFVDGGSGGAV